MKRVFDFLMSLIAIIVFSPIIIIISLLVKLTSKGPIFFKQRRIGKNNEEFNIDAIVSISKDSIIHITNENIDELIKVFLWI